MRPSAFNLRVPMPDGDVFLMNTLTDAQVLVSGEVVSLLDRIGTAACGPDTLRDDERAAVGTLSSHGFVVRDEAAERSALEQRFAEFREDVTDLRVTILTTLQCNFACEYCYQGDHGAGPVGETMSLDTAARVSAWIARRVDEVRPARLVLSFFGGEPLLNVPALAHIAEACRSHTATRGVAQVLTIVTNGLLLTPEVVDRLLPLGLAGVKVTLDGDRDAHDRMRPLRGGQGTFDRIIDNVRRVADRVPVAVGGNFDASTAGRYPALLDFLRSQPFAARLADITFKPVVKPARNGRCPSAAGATAGSACDGCHVADDQMSFLRAETRRRGFATADGVHMGPCELYRRHSHTIGPDGSLYACPGFTGDNALPIGHISGRSDAALADAAGRVEDLAPWRRCGNCSFIPVCGGGCAVAAQSELGDMEAPSCHKRAFEMALIALAADAAGASTGRVQ
jgi:uncharacterized protein